LSDTISEPVFSEPPPQITSFNSPPAFGGGGPISNDEALGIIESAETSIPAPGDLSDDLDIGLGSSSPSTSLLSGSPLDFSGFNTFPGSSPALTLDTSLPFQGVNSADLVTNFDNQGLLFPTPAAQLVDTSVASPVTPVAAPQAPEPLTPIAAAPPPDEPPPASGPPADDSASTPAGAGVTAAQIPATLTGVPAGLTSDADNQANDAIVNAVTVAPVTPAGVAPTGLTNDTGDQANNAIVNAVTVAPVTPAGVAPTGLTSNTGDQANDAIVNASTVAPVTPAGVAPTGLTSNTGDQANDAIVNASTVAPVTPAGVAPTGLTNNTGDQTNDAIVNAVTATSSTNNTSGLTTISFSSNGDAPTVSNAALPSASNVTSYPNISVDPNDPNSPTVNIAITANPDGTLTLNVQPSMNLDLTQQNAQASVGRFLTQMVFGTTLGALTAAAGKNPFTIMPAYTGGQIAGGLVFDNSQAIQSLISYGLQMQALEESGVPYNSDLVPPFPVLGPFVTNEDLMSQFTAAGGLLGTGVGVQVGMNMGFPNPSTFGAWQSLAGAYIGMLIAQDLQQGQNSVLVRMAVLAGQSESAEPFSTIDPADLILDPRIGLSDQGLDPTAVTKSLAANAAVVYADNTDPGTRGFGLFLAAVAGTVVKLVGPNASSLLTAIENLPTPPIPTDGLPISQPPSPPFAANSESTTNLAQEKIPELAPPPKPVDTAALEIAAGGPFYLGAPDPYAQFNLTGLSLTGPDLSQIQVAPSEPPSQSSTTTSSTNGQSGDQPLTGIPTVQQELPPRAVTGQQPPAQGVSGNGGIPTASGPVLSPFETSQPALPSVSGDQQVAQALIPNFRLGGNSILVPLPGGGVTPPSLYPQSGTVADDTQPKVVTSAQLVPNQDISGPADHVQVSSSSTSLTEQTQNLVASAAVVLGISAAMVFVRHPNESGNGRSSRDEINGHIMAAQHHMRWALKFENLKHV